MNKLIFLFLVTFSFSALGEETKRAELEPLNTPRPEYPSPEQAKQYLPGTSYMHVFVQGFVKVQYLVQDTGVVSDVAIIESSNVPTRELKDRSFEGFLETNVLPTMAKWRFKPLPQACVAYETFYFELEEDK